MKNRSFAMNGGEGPLSYAQNSSFHRSAFEAQKRLIDEAIAKSFDPTMIITTTYSKNLINIADLGCSTGPNTFIAMHTITEAIKNHLHKHNNSHKTLEFQVFFNDQVSNDFNTLFNNLPPNRSYLACGVPGSFRGRLFPTQSLHFVHSASTLHWLSRVPKSIVDRSCSAWNKGRIHHTDAPKEVGEAYEAQFKEDLEGFLSARAEEVVGNGLMALQIPTAPDEVVAGDDDGDNKGIHPGRVFELLGSSLMDMARLGIMTEEKVDSFNLPIFYSAVKGVKAILEENEYFSVEKMEAMNLEKFYAVPNVYTFVSLYRVVMEDLIKQHFGGAIVDELFDRFTQKVLEFPDIMNPTNLKIVMLFVLLKRKM